MDLNTIAQNYVKTHTSSREGEFFLSEIEWAKLIDGISVDGTTLVVACRDDVPRWKELSAKAGKQIRSFLTVAPTDDLRHLKDVQVLDRSGNLIAEWEIGVLPDGRAWKPKR